jgi:tetratricopeptide (TPR) repeat protein
LEEPDDALDLINRAIPVLKKVLEQQPDHAQARLFQRNAYWNRAEILGVLARHREAVEDWHKALELDSGQTRSLFQRKLCLSLARSGQYAQAGALATELAKERVHSPDAAYDFACLYALFVDGVERDANLDDDVRQRGADQHARRAVALLKALAKSGYFHSDKNRRKLQRDPDLKALRQRDAFRQFAKSVSVPF